jgi:predicted porin
MKKIVASVGMVALGASGIQTASAQDALQSSAPTKPWSVSASLRGFYDDNTGTVPNDAQLAPGQHKASFGYEVSPTAALAWSAETTTINLGMLYSFQWYENKPPNSTDHSDQTFTFNAGVTHAFSERFQGGVNDSFVIGQEPDYLRAGNAFATFQRLSGDNIRNYGSISLDAQVTPLFGLSFGYDNAYYDYAASGASQGPVNPGQPPLGPSQVVPSSSGVLDRIENGVRLEGTVALLPQTKALLGYSFRDIGFTGNELIGGYVINPLAPITPANIVPGTAVMSDQRNFREHRIYIGALHTFRPELSGSLRAGGSYTDYYNDPSGTTTIAPYIEGSLRWNYAVESYVEGGLSYDQSATDQVGLLGAGNFTLSQLAGTIFATVNHRFTPKIYGSLSAQFQNSLYNGGSLDGETEQYYLLGLNMEYRFNPNWSAHAGYNYDNLHSNLSAAAGPNRSFDRNRVYIGLTATY